MEKADRARLAAWLRGAQANQARYLLVLHEPGTRYFYPWLCQSAPDYWLSQTILDKPMPLRLVEVYDLARDWADQLAEAPAWHPPAEPPPRADDPTLAGFRAFVATLDLTGVGAA